MRIDIDTYREIVDTLTRNKTRSLLTGFGVFWGVFMLIVLIGGSRGLKEMLEANFSGFATNAAVVWSQPTSKPYMGFRKGRYWNMNVRDIERLRRQVPRASIVLEDRGLTEEARHLAEYFCLRYDGVMLETKEH